MLLTLRNAIAHGNGRKDAVNENYWKKIQIWENEGKGISSVGGYLSFSSSFVKDTLELVSNSLGDLIGRARAFK